MKRAAILRLKRKYWLVVVICLLLGFFGISYTSSITAIRSLISGPESKEFTQWRKVIHDIARGDIEQGDARTEQYIEERQKTSEK